MLLLSFLSGTPLNYTRANSVVQLRKLTRLLYIYMTGDILRTFSSSTTVLSLLKAIVLGNYPEDVDPISSDKK